LNGRSPPLRIALYCRVVDNVGDAGVCWRLARQLVAEHRCEVTLYVDRLDVMRPLWPPPPSSRSRAADPVNGLEVEGVRVRPWPADDDPPTADPRRSVDVLLSTFGCDLPDAVRRALAVPSDATTGGRPPLWINVEHLSAEDWVESAHRRPSVKPADGAVEHYFFPGFTAATGGLLREADLPARQAALAAPAAREARLRALGAPPGGMGAAPVTVSLFCYPVDTVLDLLDGLAAHSRPVRLLVPEGIASDALGRYFGRPPNRDGGPLTRGALQATALRWLDQRSYDDLLHACDLNFVRGEDSWIRAHWAGRPFVWQPYPQDDATRRIKLDAWLARLTAGWPAEAADATRALHHAWIGDGRLGDAWPRFARWAFSARGAACWQAFQMSLRRQPDLVSQLLEFTGVLASG